MVPVAGFNVILENKCIFLLLYLPSAFCFTSDLENVLLVDQEISLRVQVHLVICQELVEGKSFPKASGIDQAMVQGEEQVRVLKEDLIRFLETA